MILVKVFCAELDSCRKLIAGPILDLMRSRVHRSLSCGMCETGMIPARGVVKFGDWGSNFRPRSDVGSAAVGYSAGRHSNA
jgi:hypothetical protein